MAILDTLVQESKRQIHKFATGTLNATSTNNSHYIFKYLGIEPLKLIVLCEYGSVRLSATRVITLFSVDAVKLWWLTAANEDTEVYVGRA
jgi:hypothetical protein